MKSIHVGAAALSVAMLAGCATDWERSYRRWYDYKANAGPYGRWALCIEQRSGHYIEPNGLGPVAGSPEGNRLQLFTRVLEDCRDLMTGPGWNDLLPEQAERLISDAYQAFGQVEADAMARMTAAISTESRN